MAKKLQCAGSLCPNMTTRVCIQCGKPVCSDKCAIPVQHDCSPPDGNGGQPMPFDLRHVPEWLKKKAA